MKKKNEEQKSLAGFKLSTYSSAVVRNSSVLPAVCVSDCEFEWCVCDYFILYFRVLRQLKDQVC